MEYNKCSHCCRWVDCKTKGFCLSKDLFTYTEVEEDVECPEYEEGKPIPEDEFEEAQWF